MDWRPPMKSIWILFAALIAFAGVEHGAQARSGDRQYAAVDNHDPVQFLRILRDAQDMLKSGRGREFRIYLLDRGVLLVIPGSTNIQKEVFDIKRRNPNLKIIACKETVDAITKNAKRRPPLLPGTTIESCNNTSRRLDAAGWLRGPVL